jgi:hypothetical protein
MCVYMCPHTSIYVCPHTSIYVCPCYYVCVCADTAICVYICILLLLYVCPHTSIYVCPYEYVCVCVLILLNVCPQDASSAAVLADALQGLNVGGGVSRSGGGTEERCGGGKQGERDRGMRRAGMRSRPLETEACGAHAF